MVKDKAAVNQPVVVRVVASPTTPLDIFSYYLNYTPVKKILKPVFVKKKELESPTWNAQNQPTRKPGTGGWIDVTRKMFGATTGKADADALVAFKHLCDTH